PPAVRVAGARSRVPVRAARDWPRSSAAERRLVQLQILWVRTALDDRDPAALVDVDEPRVSEVDGRQRANEAAVGLAELQLPLAGRFAAPEKRSAIRDPMVVVDRLDPCVVVLAQQLTRLARSAAQLDHLHILLL